MLPMTEEQARASERPGEHSCGFTAADPEALLETLTELVSDSQFTRLLVEKTPEGLFTVSYRRTSHA
jgi:hypothetical protein